MYTRMSK